MLEGLTAHIADEQSKFLLLPEMCFSDWLAADPDPDPERWQNAINSHNDRIAAIDRLGVHAAIGTRPIINESGSHHNQAYLWSAKTGIHAVHEKYYLPNEGGYWEANWYQRGELRFDSCNALEMKIGVQICTEMWFFE